MTTRSRVRWCQPLFASPVLKLLCGMGLAVGLLTLWPGAEGHAQQAPARSTETEEVVVTGSRIRRQDFTANSPITTVTSETFEQTSTIGIETVLNQLPQFVPAV